MQNFVKLRISSHSFAFFRTKKTTKRQQRQQKDNTETTKKGPPPGLSPEEGERRCLAGGKGEVCIKTPGSIFMPDLLSGALINEWLQRWDLNPRSSGYGPDEMDLTSLRCSKELVEVSLPSLYRLATHVAVYRSIVELEALEIFLELHDRLSAEKAVWICMD